MGKKKNNKTTNLPFVSICTPTFNRRPFIPFTIKCYLHQDYPKDKMEWIIIDDGSDLIEDLVKDVPGVKYFKYTGSKMTLGKKRNLMHEKSKGDIIVYMDDDDYYPPQRVSHAVNMLQTHPNAICAGASEIYIWFKHIQKMWQFGPYSPNHATAGTFAFKRELLKDHKYDENASLAEEKSFLKNYTVPFVQLEPKKTILVFSHIQNTFDKKKLLEQGENKFQKGCDRTVDEFVKEPEMKEFYMETIDELLKNYSPGDPSNKPDVLKQIKEIDAERKKMMEQNAAGGKIILNQEGKQIELNNQQIVQIMQQQQQQGQQQQQQLEMLMNKIQEKDIEIAMLKNNNTKENENIFIKDNIKELDNTKNLDTKVDELEKIILRQEENIKQILEISLSQESKIKELLENFRLNDKNINIEHEITELVDKELVEDKELLEDKEERVSLSIKINN